MRQTVQTHYIRLRSRGILIILFKVIAQVFVSHECGTCTRLSHILFHTGLYEYQNALKGRFNFALKSYVSRKQQNCASLNHRPSNSLQEIGNAVQFIGLLQKREMLTQFLWNWSWHFAHENRDCLSTRSRRVVCVVFVFSWHMGLLKDKQTYQVYFSYGKILANLQKPPFGNRKKRIDRTRFQIVRIFVITATTYEPTCTSDKT